MLRFGKISHITGLATALALIVVSATPAEAQRRFGGGGFRGGGAGGGFHARAPVNFHAPGSGGGGIHNPSLPREGGGGGGGGPGPRPNPGPNPGPHPGPGPGPGPGPNPGPHPAPGPGPNPGPHPGPGPGPGPGPHPGPPPPPPPPPPPGWGWGWGWDDDPFWDAAAVGIVAGTTAAVVASAAQPDTVVIQSTAVGSVVYTLPSNCPKVVRSNVAYYSCNNVWYLPQYQSSGVTYLIVNPPG